MAMMNNHLEALQFPQPTRPVDAQQDTLPFQLFEATWQNEGKCVDLVDDKDLIPTMMDYYSNQVAHKTCDHQFFKKLYAKVEDEIISFKKFVREEDEDLKRILERYEKFRSKLHEKLMKISENGGVNIQERGVDIENMDLKLERFKVKTVNVGGGGSGGGGGQGGVNVDGDQK